MTERLRPEEVTTAAAESAEFARWTATTNVDDQILDQMDADIVEMAQRFLIDPPAAVFAQLLDGRNTLFELITAGRVSHRG